MGTKLTDRLMHGWNAFMGRDPTPATQYVYTESSRTSQVTLSRGSERDMVNATLNRIAVDVAALTVEHVRVDDENRFRESIASEFNSCLTLSANIDQSARMFLQDAAMSLLTEGVIAIVPTEATADPRYTGSYDIGSLRIGQVVEWFPKHVKVNLYNENTGRREDRVFPKSMVALPENPFYDIMNRPNSTYRRLVEKLRQLDVIDRNSASGKLDLIIQVPYSTRSRIHKEQAETRRKDIETQLAGSKYGVAYIDGTEKVIQLNRAIENNLFTQVEYYYKMLHSQLGMPESIFDGTADEATMLNYQNRTIEPIISAIVDSMRWKFLTKTARTQGQSVVFFNDPFKFATVENIAKNADTLRRNEILTANEIRQILGFKPDENPNADMLSNPNMPVKDQSGQQVQTGSNLPGSDTPVSQLNKDST